MPRTPITTSWGTRTEPTTTWSVNNRDTLEYYTWDTATMTWDEATFTWDDSYIATAITTTWQDPRYDTYILDETGDFILDETGDRITGETGSLENEIRTVWS